MFPFKVLLLLGTKLAKILVCKLKKYLPQTGTWLLHITKRSRAMPASSVAGNRAWFGASIDSCPLFYFLLCWLRDFPGGSDGKVSVYNAGDQGSSPGLGRSLGEGNGSPLQYYCLENPMDRRLQFVGSQRVGHDWATTLHFTLTGYHPKLCPSCFMRIKSKKPRAS